MSRTFLAAWNVLKVVLLSGTFCGLAALAGYELGGLRLLPVFLACSVLVVATGSLAADRLVLALLGARELPLAQAPAVHAAVERLALRAGVPRPRVYVMPAGLPLALVAGRGAGAATLVVSSGLLVAAPPAELEGVLAHEIAHLRLRDVTTQSAAVVLASTLVEASRAGGHRIVQRGLLLVLGPIAAAFVHLLLSPKRELEADRLAAELCESPHGLADALLRLDQATELVEYRASPATSPLYTIDPFERTGLAALFATHPPVSERIQALRRLDPGWRDRLRAA